MTSLLGLSTPLSILSVLSPLLHAHPVKLTIPSTLSLFISSIIIYLILTILYKTFIAPHLSSLKDVPGPGRPSVWLGNLERIIEEEPGIAHVEWSETYGGAVRYFGSLGVSFVLVRFENERRLIFQPF